MAEEIVVEENQKKLEELGRRVFRHPLADSFEMKRVPKTTIETFKKFANEEFIGDYGMAFKYMVDNFLVEDARFLDIFRILNEHEQAISKLNGQPPAPQAKARTMLSGKQIATK